MVSRFCIVEALAIGLLFASCALATQTENFGIRVLRAPGPVNVDGKADDWNLSGGIFACDDVENRREQFAVVHAMYDAENLYVLAHFIDPTPLNNPGHCTCQRMVHECRARHDDVFGRPAVQNGRRDCMRCAGIRSFPSHENAGGGNEPGISYRADFGVTHGDAAGQRTRLRTYWNNQLTGIVDDAVFELQMEPKNWGEIVFEK